MGTTGAEQRNREREVEPARGSRLKTQPPERSNRGPHQSGGKRKRPGAEETRKHVRIDRRLRGDVERSTNIPHDRLKVCLGNIVAVYALNPEPLESRNEWHEPRPKQPAGQEWAGEDTPNPGRSGPLEDQRRTETHNPQTGGLALDII